MWVWEEGRGGGDGGKRRERLVPASGADVRASERDVRASEREVWAWAEGRGRSKINSSLACNCSSSYSVLRHERLPIEVSVEGLRFRVSACDRPVERI